MNFDSFDSSFSSVSQGEQISSLSQSLIESKKREQELLDELISTKTKLQNAQSQLERMPKWTVDDKYQSDASFIQAKAQAEINSVNSKLIEKEHEIEQLKKENSSKSPEISYFIKSICKSIQKIIRKGTFSDQKDEIANLNSIYKNFKIF